MESSVGENGSEGTSFPHCIQTLPTHGAFSPQSELHETKGSAFHPIHSTSLCKTCFYQTKPQNVCKAAHIAINVIIRNEAHPENCRVPTFYSLEWPRSGEVRSKSCTVALLIILVEQGVRGGVVVVVEVSQWWGMVMETQGALICQPRRRIHRSRRTKGGKSLDSHAAPGYLLLLSSFVAYSSFPCSSTRLTCMIG